MRIILDFDRVIFNFDRFLEAYEALNQPELFAHPDVWDYLTVRDFFYVDALPFIQSHNPQDVIIISAMSPELGPYAREYQKRKLAESQLESYTKEIVVMEGDKASWVSDRSNGDTFFIDDKLDHHESTRAVCPEVHTLQMVRGGSLESGVSRRPDIPVVRNFCDVSAIISKTCHES